MRRLVDDAFRLVFLLVSDAEFTSIVARPVVRKLGAFFGGRFSQDYGYGYYGWFLARNSVFAGELRRAKLNMTISTAELAPYASKTRHLNEEM